MKKICNIVFFVIILAAFVFIQPALFKDAANATNELKIFQEKGFGYSIQYPADWIYNKQAAHILLFSRKEGVDKYVPIIGIQNLLSTKVKEGKYHSISAVIEDFQNQLKITKHAKVFPAEPFIYNRNDLKLAGQQFLAEYNYNGKNSKQWLIVLPRANGNVFHVFIYSAPVEQYDKYYGAAKAMLDSWIIEK
ncbi:MAG: hypothetical protein NTX75_11370 [Proteobacteria bacterium]|nr:hypothetical protein [Pseudomonadota bacterium]